MGTVAQEISQTEVHNKIHNLTSSVLPAIRQPPGECDPESDLPCSCPRRSFADLSLSLQLPCSLYSQDMRPLPNLASHPGAMKSSRPTTLSPPRTMLGHGQEVGGGGPPARVEGHGEAPRFEDPAARPVRQRKHNVRYPATQYDLNSNRMRSRRTIMRAT